MNDVVVAHHLRKSYRSVAAVADVSFSVHEGEVFGLLGLNGAGKTTTVECLQGLRSRDGGEVSVLGVDPARRPRDLRGRVGSQLQSSALPDRLQVSEAIRLFGSLHVPPVDTARVMAEWDLTELRNRSFADLSGGQQQRLFLALALLGEPKLVFLDELTTGLDPPARHATWALISAVRERGTTVVLVTHLMEEAERLCDRVAIIDRGVVAAIGPPSALVARHASVRITFEAAGQDLAFLHSVVGVSSISTVDRVVTVLADAASTTKVAAALATQGIFPREFRTHHPSLEDVFMAVTGREMPQ